MTITYSEAQAMMRTARNGSRKLGNNTYLVPRGANDYAVQLHNTDVVTIHADGTFTLRTGSWYTVTTKDRINGFGPARVYSEGGTWAVYSADDPRTPPKMQRCRKCKGAGRVHQDGYRRHYESTWDDDGHYHYKNVFPPIITLPSYPQCHVCGGTGQRDYGSQPMPVVFFDGIRVDGQGRVLDADLRERLHDPEAEAKRAEAARIETARRAEAARIAARSAKARRRPWLMEHGLTRRSDGTVVMFKAVNPGLFSAHGALYEIGAEVIAPDYKPTEECGTGLHFSPTPRDALHYVYGSQDTTRFLACAVEYKTMIPLGSDKVKARSCRVLYEVDAEGNRIGAQS